MAGSVDADTIFVTPGQSLQIIEKYIPQQGIIAGLDPSKAGQAGAAQIQKVVAVMGPGPFEGTFQGTALLPAAPPAGMFTCWFDTNGNYKVMNSAGVVKTLTPT